MQGVTEWLPVSSSAMLLLLLVNFFGMGGGEALELVFLLHLGSAAAVVAYFRQKLSMPALRFVLVATLASGLSGAPLYLVLVKELGAAPGGAINVLVGVALLATAAVLRFQGGGGRKSAEVASLKDMALAGFAQGIAVMPGISRSGITIATLLMLGYRPAEALRLSFLMAVPAILGLNLVNAGAGMSASAVAGAAVSLGVSLLSIHLMLDVARRGRFEYLCLLLGVLAIAAGVSGLG